MVCRPELQLFVCTRSSTIIRTGCWLVVWLSMSGAWAGRYPYRLDLKRLSTGLLTGCGRSQARPPDRRDGDRHSLVLPPSHQPPLPVPGTGARSEGGRPARHFTCSLVVGTEYRGRIVVAPSLE
jgi:hypothetical protein